MKKDNDNVGKNFNFLWYFKTVDRIFYPETKNIAVIYNDKISLKSFKLRYEFLYCANLGYNSYSPRF